jgi:hypothetical protein
MNRLLHAVVFCCAALALPAVQAATSSASCRPPAAAIDEVLRQDRAANVTIDTVSAVQQAARRVEAIDLSCTPREFADVYRRHVAAWRQAARLQLSFNDLPASVSREIRSTHIDMTVAARSQGARLKDDASGAPNLTYTLAAECAGRLLALNSQLRTAEGELRAQLTPLVIEMQDSANDAAMRLRETRTVETVEREISQARTRAAPNPGAPAGFKAHLTRCALFAEPERLRSTQEALGID